MTRQESPRSLYERYAWSSGDNPLVYGTIQINYPPKGGLGVVLLPGNIAFPYDQGHVVEPAQGAVCPFPGLGSSDRKRPPRIRMR